MTPPTGIDELNSTQIWPDAESDVAVTAATPEVLLDLRVAMAAPPAVVVA